MVSRMEQINVENKSLSFTSTYSAQFDTTQLYSF